MFGLAREGYRPAPLMFRKQAGPRFKSERRLHSAFSQWLRPPCAQGERANRPPRSSVGARRSDGANLGHVLLERVIDAEPPRPLDCDRWPRIWPEKWANEAPAPDRRGRAPKDGSRLLGRELDGLNRYATGRDRSRWPRQPTEGFQTSRPRRRTPGRNSDGRIRACRPRTASS
jgi:hypothetical protein